MWPQVRRLNSRKMWENNLKARIAPQLFENRPCLTLESHITNLTVWRVWKEHGGIRSHLHLVFGPLLPIMWFKLSPGNSYNKRCDFVSYFCSATNNWLTGAANFNNPKNNKCNESVQNVIKLPACNWTKSLHPLEEWTSVSPVGSAAEWPFP